ncbi:hypothetical protein HPB47_022150 [Ixodes persulcatus]|uniref:Uncharacterized protein n=1 Tax=Ixodes persulcatus TaxID=34615 RepID=A0AC60QAI4_IXOPE|nr:hypothetical protein HPB47_022150 [Ixodes persulcatus]
MYETAPRISPVSMADIRLFPESHGIVDDYMYDSERREFFLGLPHEHAASAHWWDLAEPVWLAAERRRLRSAVYWWPGCEVALNETRPAICMPHRSPHGWHALDADFRRKLDEVLEVFDTDELSLAMLYYGAVAYAGHFRGPESKERHKALLEFDNHLNYLLDKLEALNLTEKEKLLQTTKLSIANRDYAVNSYPSAPTNSCKGVIHGVASLTAPDELIANIESNVPVLTARMMGKTETALITFEGTYVPYTIYYRRLQFRCHPHKPKSQQCQNCLQLSHRAEVCPKKGKLTVCDICYQENMTSDTLHNCVPYCVNCKEEHASKDPNCPTKKQADAQATLAAYKRRVQQRPKATTIPNTLRTPPPPPKPKGGKASATPSPPHQPTPPSDKVPTANSRRENYRLPPIPRGSTQQHRRTRSLSRNNKDTQGSHNLPQYTPHTQPSITQTDRRQNTYTPTLVTTYISKEHPSIQLNTTDINTAHQEHVIITLQPRNCPNPITIVNAYWRPGRKVANPTPWLTKLVANNTDHDLLLVGDFNSPNVSWGYPNTQHNGRLLEQATAQTSMTLANDTTQPTRTGNSVERDTNPDLAFHHGPSVAEWSASDEQLSSDHRLIHLTLITNVKQKVRRNTARITNWDHFRYHTSNNPPPTDADPRAWANHLLQAQKKCTKEAQTTTATPYIDTHLLNLWKTRRKLGRYILNSLGYDTLHLPPIETTTPPWDTIPQITTLPIPKHMNLDSSPERRKHRAKLISQKLATLQAQQHLIYYTDASYDRGTKLGRTAIHCPQTNTTLRQTYTEAPSADLLETQALCSAIHHAIANPHEGHTSITVLTDSQKAVRTFQYNQLPNYMSRELRAALNTNPTLRFYIYWIPGHALIPGNERAHSLSRVTSTPGPAIDWPTSYDSQLQRNEYHQQRSDTLRQLRESRLALVPPPPTLSRQQASTLRRAQTHTLSSPHYTHLFQGAQGTAKCPFSSGYPNNTHTYWQCLHAQPSIRSALSKLPPGLRPTTWNEWISPPNPQHVPAIFDALLQHITTIEEKLRASKDVTNPP